ncbi:MAG: response regulator, partial [Gammaproteobacteria bacterium]|nr:response regulator [Gammaproteobacteria bacterium]
GREASGLGLSISQHFVELFGGSLEVESRLGQGSVFRFSIDVTIAHEGEVAQQVRNIGGLAPGQPLYKLLVVEDVEFSRILLVNLLERIGFEVQSAVNGEQAISMVASFQPDLIWMDILMPVIDGKEATKHIRQLPGGDRLPIIAVTASATLMDKTSLLACGFDDVMFKPYHQTQIIECLEAQLGVVFVDKLTVAIDTPARILAGLDKGQLKAIPDENRAALRQAVTEGDIEKIQQLIEALPDDLAELKVALLSLVEDFEFETLLQGLGDEQ